MAVDYKALKDALKIMTDAPASIKRAESRYQDKLADIEARSRDLSPNYKDKLKAEAKEDRNIVVSRLMDQMDKAIYTIDANNSFDGEAFDFSDPKFQSAVNFLNLMGADMTPVDQVNMLESFRGNVGALKAIGSAMRKNGLFFADQANEMAKTIPESAITDAAVFIGTYRYDGTIDYSRMQFSGSEFEKQAKRLGYSMEDAPDPYISALADARNLIHDVTDDPKAKARNNAVRIKIDMAIKDIQTAKATGKGSVEDIFSKAIRSVENLPADIEQNSAEQQ